VNNFFETLKQLGALRIAILGLVLFTLIGFFVFVSLKVSSPSMKLLYADLSAADSASVAGKLEELSIPYQVSPDGSKIMVSDAEVGRARMLLAQEGLPNGGSMGYEIFDQQSGFGTTNFVQNINQVRALEGELARTIASLNPIASARVHLVLPQRELFARENRPASASVFIRMKANSRLSNEQIAAIQSLVSSAVQDLKSDHVSVIDSNGNLLARGEGDTATGNAPMKTEEMRQGYESRLTAAIEDMVSRTVGYGNVRATVTADLNFDRISTNEELYDPEQQVVRSTQTTTENATERTPPGGEVSASGNIPGNVSDALVQSAPNNQSNKTEETTNYEIGKTVRSMVREVGEVKRLSVAVLINGITKTAEDGTKTYEQRSDAELKQIETLVKSAIGFDEKRGDQVSVINMAFAEAEVPPIEDTSKILGFERADLLDAAQVVVVAILIMLVVLLILQPMLSKLISSTLHMSENTGGNQGQGLLGGGGMMMNPALAGPSNMGALPNMTGGMPAETPHMIADQSGSDENTMINVKSIEGKVKASAVKKVEDIVAAYPNETVSVLRGWMAQE
jgi:flagellar M-ring protein FliF